MKRYIFKKANTSVRDFQREYAYIRAIYINYQYKNITQDDSIIVGDIADGTANSGIGLSSGYYDISEIIKGFKEAGVTAIFNEYTGLITLTPPTGKKVTITDELSELLNLPTEITVVKTSSKPVKLFPLCVGVFSNIVDLEESTVDGERSELLAIVPVNDVPFDGLIKCYPERPVKINNNVIDNVMVYFKTDDDKPIEFTDFLKYKSILLTNKIY